VRRLPPRLDVLQRLGQVELLQRVVEMDLKPRPAQLEQVLFLQPGGVFQDLGIERRVVPPVGCNLADRARHEANVYRKAAIGSIIRDPPD